MNHSGSLCSLYPLNFLFSGRNVAIFDDLLHVSGRSKKNQERLTIPGYPVECIRNCSSIAHVPFDCDCLKTLLKGHFSRY